MFDVMLLFDKRHFNRASKVANWLKKHNLTVLVEDNAVKVEEANVFIICLSMNYMNMEKCKDNMRIVSNDANRVIIAMFEEFKPPESDLVYKKYWYNITKEIDGDMIKFEFVMNSLLDEINAAINAYNQNKKRSAEINLFVENLLHKPLKEYLWLTGLKRVLDDKNNVEKLFDKYELSDADLQTIIQTDYGGGKPALTFLEMLRQRKFNVPISELHDICMRNNLFEPMKFLEKYNLNNFISSITASDISKLSVMLSPLPKRPQEDWIIVAESFDLGDIVPICKQSSRRVNCYSRTEALLNIIRMKWPDHTIRDFMENLVLSGLEDAVEVIQNQVKKVAEKKLTEEAKQNDNF